MSHPGNSQTQQAAEHVMIEWLAAELGISLATQKLDLDNGSWLQIDGVSIDPPVLVEAWAHQGKPKSAQRNKVAADALKLSFAGKALGTDPRLILLFADEEAAAEFRSSSWRASAIADMGIEVTVAEIGRELRSEIRDAQQKQYR